MIKKKICVFEYIIIFLGFALMYFFIIPDSDVFYFTADYENSMRSFITSALYYGNGRLLGNIIGFFFSFNIKYAFILISFILSGITVLLNKLFFNNDLRTAFPVAFLVAIPSVRLMGEVYTQLPTFINYTIPVFLSLLSLLFIIKSNKSKHSLLYLAPVFIINFCSCLFTENNTATIVTLFVLTTFYSIIKNKRIKTIDIFSVLGIAFGGITMIMIPKLFMVSDKLDYYRDTAHSIGSFINQSIACFSTFTEIFSRFSILIFVASACLFFHVKNSEIKGNKIKNFLKFYFVFYPIEALIYSVLSSNTPDSVYQFIPQAGFTVIYALSIFVAILLQKKSDFKTVLIGFYILLLSTVGPMLFSNLYGYRTFYSSFIVFLMFTLYLFKNTIGEIIGEFNAQSIKEHISKSVTCICGLSFVCMSFLFFYYSVYNYNFYTVRTEYIINEVSVGTEHIYVPYLPCRSISIEEENPTILEATLYKVDTKSNIEFLPVYYCENQVEYTSILNSNPVSNTINAFHNLKYRDPAYLAEQLK